MNTTRLRNGSLVASPLLYAIERILRFAAIDDVQALMAAVALARDPGHRCSDAELVTLETWSLVNAEGTMNEDVRNIIISSAEGDGVDLVIASPVMRAR